MRIGTTNAATCVARMITVAWGVSASADATTTAVTAKLAAHTAVSTRLMCANRGVSQYSRGATRLANVSVNGCPHAIDTIAATANAAGMSAGTKWCSAAAGSAIATTVRAPKITIAAPPQGARAGRPQPKNRGAAG